MVQDTEAMNSYLAFINRAAIMVAEGKSKEEVSEIFISEGMPKDIADSIAQRGEEAKHAAFRKEGQTTLLIGIGLTGLGIVITMASYNAASGGGSFIVTTGLVVGGIWIALKGLWRMGVG